MLISVIITFTELIRVKEKSTLVYLFIGTLFFSSVDILSNYIFLDYLKSENKFTAFAKFNQYIFYFLEILTIAYFYYNLFENKKILKYSFFIFLFSFAFTLAYFKFFSLSSPGFTFSVIVLFELIFINFSFALFLKENLEIDYTNKVKQLNIINYGFFIFVNFTAPFYFISTYKSKQNGEDIYLSFITYLGYTILFSSIFKSLRWKI